MTPDPPVEKFTALSAWRPDLYERGLKLWETQAGVNELAWCTDDAIEAVNALVNAGHCILGGDQWDVADQRRPRPTYENWYYNPVGSSEDALNSRTAALAFIEAHRRPSDRWIVVVWR